MSISNGFFLEWMRLPGLVKKLQFFLLFSVVLNLLLLQQLIIKPHKQASTSKIEQSQELAISEADLKGFIRSFLDNFFSTSLEAEGFLKRHSGIELFPIVQAELINRRNLKISSHLQINDLYLDSVSAKLVKAIVLGEELFDSGLTRKITLELLINTDVDDKDNLLVESIPVLEIT